MVPTIVADAATVIDPWKRETRDQGLMAETKRRTPFWREGLEIRRDVFGKQMREPGGRTRIIDPFLTMTESSDPVVQEMMRVSYTPGRLQKEKTEPRNLYNVRATLHGEILHDELRKAIESDTYQDVEGTADQRAEEQRDR